jgi:hypothetical protein
VNTPKAEIKPHSRYAMLPLTIDHSFDDIQDRSESTAAVRAKHSWHARLRNAGRLK